MKNTVKNQQRVPMNNASEISPNDITAVILAGGRATRMGGIDKGLLPLNHKPMIHYIIESLRSQVSDIIISANRNQAEYRKFGFPVINDNTDGYEGPLAGIASAMNQINTAYLLTVPCDTPLCHPELAKRLCVSIAREQKSLGVAHDGVRLQALFMLLETRLHKNLEQFLAQGHRKVKDWIALNQHAIADFSDQTDAFLNVNSEDELKHAERMLGQNLC